MKRIYFILSIIILSFSAYTQRSYFGMELVTPSITWVEGGLENQTIRWNPVNFGLSGNIQISPNVGIKIGARLVGMGTRIKDEKENVIAAKFKFKYAQFPLLLSLRTRGGFALQAGPYAGKLYVAKYYNPEERADDITLAVLTLGIAQPGNYKITNQCHEWDTGFLVGLGYQMDHGYIGIRYQYGMSEVIEFNEKLLYNQSVELVWEISFRGLCKGFKE